MKATSARLALVGQITQHFPPAKKKLKKPSVLSHPIPSHPSSEGAAATDDKPFLPPSTSSFSSAGFFPFLFLHSPAKAIRASSEKREGGRKDEQLLSGRGKGGWTDQLTAQTQDHRLGREKGGSDRGQTKAGNERGKSGGEQHILFRKNI